MINDAQFGDKLAMVDDARDENSDAPSGQEWTSSAPAPSGDVPATPAAQATAADAGVDLSDVKGTGKHGKVTKADVEAVTPGSDWR